MDKYEISLWEDFPDLTENNIPFLNERKICTIGSDTMRGGARAVEPKMINNVNGTNTFSFKMYYDYIDDFTGEKCRNPFIPLLINERKVKVFWKGVWYDLIIKDIEEESAGKGNIYTCQDLAITELSKNGFNLELTSELQNNIGTAAELAQRVLEGSGWQFDAEKSSNIIQQTEEPVYEVLTIGQINTTLQSSQGDQLQLIPSNQTILVFYSGIVDITNTDFIDKDIQFLYSSTEYQTDEGEMLVTNGNCYIASFQVRKNQNYIEFYQSGAEKFRINTDFGVSLKYRANRLVKTQITEYDTLLERYVGLYKDTETDKNVYGYTATKFSNPLAIINYIINAVDFKSVEGWIGENLTFGVFPKINNKTDISTYHSTSYLKINAGDIYNYAFSSNKMYFTPTQVDIKNGDVGGLQIGSKYVFRIKFKADCEDPSEAPYLYENIISPLITTFDINYKPVGENYFSIDEIKKVDDWYEYSLTCIKSCPAEDIEKIGFFLHASDTVWIQEVQLFKYATGIKSYDSTVEERINPGEVSLQGIDKTYYKYYNIDHDGAQTPEELEFLYNSETNSDRFVPIFNNYEKMTTIEAKQSNRFNILQTIAEAFKCWIRFVINHDENGKIIFNNDGTPQKYVIIKETIGENLGWSFEYGIDLKNIRRKIISTDIATKIIVQPNDNEFAKNGFCSIARSNLNYSRENFIFNFDYYINQGLLDKESLEKDLYSTSSNYIGYYTLLNQYNKEYDDITNNLNQRQLELIEKEAQLSIAEQKNKATQEQLITTKSDIMMLAGVTTWEAAQNYIRSHEDSDKIQSLMNLVSQLQDTIISNQEQLEDLTQSIENLKDFIDNNTTRQDELLSLTTNLHEQFFKKYSRFIQEGTWQDENYIDDNIYYLDALEVAYTSSRPQIQYQINIMRLSGQEDFSSKIFNVGDTCYIQDRQFFGYCADNITPYQLKITISEITSFFEQPEKDTIKVQNYKTQFEDLFQRITATVQNLKYSEGSYNKAANAINTDGTIDFDVLQDTFNTNSDLVLNSSNQQVVWDATGITISNGANTAEKVKLMSGGLFITNDGGASWKNAVRGDGISADVLTAGKINTGEIYIYDGDAPSFRWDNKGLTAYSYQNENVNFNKFIRYDKYGIYGYDGVSDFTPISENDIWEKASFGLTWKGFFLRNQNADSFFEISSDKDMVIKKGDVNRLQIGRLNGETSNYGIQLRNDSGKVIFSVDNNGATIGGWTIGTNGLIDEKNNSAFSLSSLVFNQVSITENGIFIPDVSYLNINGTPCETKTVPVIEDGTQITAQITWTDGGTQHTGTISFTWSGEVYNAICFSQQ